MLFALCFLGSVLSTFNSVLRDGSLGRSWPKGRLIQIVRVEFSIERFDGQAGILRREGDAATEALELLDKILSLLLSRPLVQ